MANNSDLRFDGSPFFFSKPFARFFNWSSCVKWKRVGEIADRKHVSMHQSLISKVIVRMSDSIINV